MQSFIFGLLLAGVSGITVLAFKHPRGYAKLFPYLLAAGTIVFLGMTVWHVAVEVTWRTADDYITEENLVAAQDRKLTLILPYAWIVFWYFALIGFLWIDLKLPPFLQITDAQGDNVNSGKPQ